MRLLVYPHELSIGGSQINAIDLAAAAAAAGHDVMVYGVPGPLVTLIAERGLRFIPAHPLKYRPAPSRIAQLAMIARQHRIDLIHTYEWPSCLDAYYGASLLFNVPLLCTVLSMQVMPHVPASVPLIMGTADLGAEAARRHRGGVWVIEPPIDIHQDNPAIDGTEFRRRHGVSPTDFVVVGVSRLAVDLKLDALVRAIDAVDLLAGDCPIKLILVGDGPAADALQRRAAAVNRRHGRPVVSLVGPELDPRAAYAAADLVVAMGSSALRALSIGRPVIVQGEDGFSEIFEPATLDLFLKQGFYGMGDGAIGAERLASQIQKLSADPIMRNWFGEFGRRTVEQRFNLERAADLHLRIYEELAANPPSRRLGEALLSAYLSVKLEVTNHLPVRKRQKRYNQYRLLDAAAGGPWPPAATS